LACNGLLVCMVSALKNHTTKKATIKPRDAATLILVRFDGPAPRILMGQRHEGHVFMPNKYVFPGGRCEAADGLLPVVNEGEAVTLEKLKLRMGTRPSHRRTRGLLVAAIRETFEETGLLAGRARVSDVPDLSGLIYFARAITPPGRNRRFDSRFFVANADIVSNLDTPYPLETDELLKVSWMTVAEALGLNLPSITREILLLLRPFLAQNALPPVDCPVSFQYSRGKSWRVEQLNLTFGPG
jgi:8-oxo-dGTP pyrophosphatase MutT (NUDIX family)